MKVHGRIDAGYIVVLVDKTNGECWFLKSYTPAPTYGGGMDWSVKKTKDLSSAHKTSLEIASSFAANIIRDQRYNKYNIDVKHIREFMN